MASVTTTTTSAAAAAASITTTPSPSAAAAKRPFLAGDDAPWRVSASGAGFRPVPRIHQSALLRVAQDHTTAHAMAVMKHQEPIGEGLALEAVVEAAGPECIVPGQPAPLRLLGLKMGENRTIQSAEMTHPNQSDPRCHFQIGLAGSSSSVSQFHAGGSFEIMACQNEPKLSLGLKN